MRLLFSSLFLVLLLGSEAATQSGPTLDDLRVGHWVRVRGHDAPDGFQAGEVEVLTPEDEESFIGMPMDSQPGGSSFVILGRPVQTRARTSWDGTVPSSLGTAQVKVEGHYRSPTVFLVNSVSIRLRPGRDRIEGRIDSIQSRGGQLEIRVMGIWIALRADVVVVADEPIRSIPLAPASVAASQERADEDFDRLTSTRSIGENLSFGGQIEYKDSREHDLDLDDNNSNPNAKRNRRQQSMILRGQLVWEPSARYYALVEADRSYRRRSERGSDTETEHDGRVNQAFLYWRFPSSQIDVQVGRQDFDEPREWIYDENLDGVRVIMTQKDLRVELSASTVLADGSRKRRETDNIILYVSNNNERKHLAAYVVDQQRTGTVHDKPIHFGVRALGEWFPDQDVWAEWSLVRGYHDSTDYQGWAVDVGSTWSPASLDPVYVTMGFATTSGDDDVDDGRDTSFRQTGLHDNNGKWGGITSFRYYGELLDPELSNLSIWTLGVGARLTPKTSLDFVAHKYMQVDASDSMRDIGVDQKKLDGGSRDLGFEYDLILGSREWAPWQCELVFGSFRPGSAFADSEEAWITKAQFRYRF
jgi:alginate production protein